MKILIVSPVFWPESFRINDVCKHFAAMGHHVEVLAGHPNYPEGRYFKGYSLWGPWLERWAGSDILRFPQIPRGNGAFWRLMAQYVSFVMIGSLRLLMQGRWDWDAVFVFQTTPVTAALPALLACKLSGARGVIWVQDLWPDSLAAVGIKLPSWLLVPIRCLSRRIYCSFDKILGQNAAFLPRLEALGVPRERLASVPQWADEAEAPMSGGAPRLWPEGRFTLLFAGNMGRAQGLEVILDAAEALMGVPELQWVFMGDGVLADWVALEVARRDLGTKVILTGRRPAEEMAFHYSQAEVLLVSLRSDPALADTLPGKIQACLSAGRPILGAVDGVAAEVIRSASVGRVVAPGDAKALVEAVRYMQSRTSIERNAMGQNGKAYYVRHFGRTACLGSLAIQLGMNPGPSAQN